jgi:hypothetical protein
MADFCHDCSIELFGQDARDLVGLCKPGEHVGVICEGCGPTHVDNEGVCMYHARAGGTCKLCYQSAISDTSGHQNEKAEVSISANSGL